MNYSIIAIYLGSKMHITHLKKVGGSVMLEIPPPLLDILKLSPGSKVGITVNNGRLVIEPSTRPRYTLAELLAASDCSKPRSAEEREWLDAPVVGRELI